MVDTFGKMIDGFKGAVVIGVMLFVLAAVIEAQEVSIDSNLIICLLSTLVPILTLASMIHDAQELQRGKVFLFFGSLIGTIFCWATLG